MPITQITTEFVGQTSVTPGLLRVMSTDDLSTITTPGYLNKIIKQGYAIDKSDFIFVNYNNGADFGIFTPTITHDVITLHLLNNQIVNQIIFTASGTYTPSPNMFICRVEAIGGGGAGGGVFSSSASDTGCGGGGGGGEYLTAYFPDSIIGSSQSITIGNGGIAVDGDLGGDGSPTMFGSLLTAAGGLGGRGGFAAGSDTITLGGMGGSSNGTTGLSYPGIEGDYGLFLTTAAKSVGGVGGTAGNGKGGAGAPTIATSTGVPGVSATANTGCGGSGAALRNVEAIIPGGNGGSGVVIVTEYLAV